LLPADKPDFPDQAFVYLNFYFVQAGNFRFGEVRTGSFQFFSVQTTDSTGICPKPISILTE